MLRFDLLSTLEGYRSQCKEGVSLQVREDLYTSSSIQSISHFTRQVQNAILSKKGH